MSIPFLSTQKEQLQIQNACSISSLAIFLTLPHLFSSLLFFSQLYSHRLFNYSIPLVPSSFIISSPSSILYPSLSHISSISASPFLFLALFYFPPPPLLDRRYKYLLLEMALEESNKVLPQYASEICKKVAHYGQILMIICQRELSTLTRLLSQALFGCSSAISSLTKIMRVSDLPVASFSLL